MGIIIDIFDHHSICSNIDEVIDMADIFISYSREDSLKVKPLAKILEENGWSVYWDVKMQGGETWDERIEKELDSAKCVLVVWSKNSIHSSWVRAEAEEGFKKGILFPILIDDVKIPLLFRPIQAVRFTSLKQDRLNQQYKILIKDISAFILSSESRVKREVRKRKDNLLFYYPVIQKAPVRKILRSDQGPT